MKKKVFISVFSLSIIVALLFFFLSNSAQITKPPEAVKGVLNISEWQFQKEGPINLDGYWTFYWKQLINPSEISRYSSDQKGEWKKMPEIWNDYQYGQDAVGPYGYATYHLTLIKPVALKRFALKIKKMESSYRLWVNNQVVAKNGIVGETADTSSPQWKSKVVIFESDESKIELTLQISNFSYKRGGFRYPIKIGTVDQILSERDKTLLFDYILIGSLLIMGFYHFSLFYYRKKDFSTLYLSLFCLIIVVRIAVMGERIILNYLPIPWEWMLKLEYLSFYLAGPMFVIFFHSLFPNETRKSIIRLFSYGAFAFSLIVIFTNASFFTKTAVIIQVMVVAIGLYVTYALILAAIRHREGVYLFITGWLAVFLCTINDVLHSSRIIFTDFWMPVGLFIFIFFQAVVLSKRFSKAFSIAELLTRELEEKVADRTEKLAKKNIQQKELLHVLCHDLSNPFANIKGFLEFSQIQKGFFEAKNHLLMESTENGLELIKLIRDISALDEGKYVVSLSQHNLKDLISKSLNIMTQRLKEKDISIDQSVDDFLTVSVEQVSFVNSVMNNLLSNAIKFSVPNSIIRIKGYQQKDKTILKIDDQGIGIPQNMLEHLFEMTKNTNRTGTQGEVGTGFGMPIIKKFIEAYGGKINIESRDINEYPDKHGTSVTLTLDP